MAKGEDQFQLENIRVVNKRDIDVVVRDFYGREHVIFPMKEKEIVVLKGRKAGNDHSKSD